MDTSSAPTPTTSPAPARSDTPRKIGGLLARIPLYLFLIIWAVIVIYPMAWSVISSLRTDQQLMFILGIDPNAD